MSDTSPAEASQSSTFLAWAQLVRLPNVFTVIADVGAAFLLVAHGPKPIGQFVCVLLSGILLYWAGMILNDVFDVEKDREERPNRPIPAGDISLGQASLAGWSLLVLGVAAAFVAGKVGAQDLVETGVPRTWYLPGIVAIALAAVIVAYDGPLKRTVLAPATMGSCRFFSFLLGASPAIAFDMAAPSLPLYVLCFACGFGVYITGVTTMARKEAEGGRSINLLCGFIVMIVGLVAIAVAPQVGGGGGWKISPARDFPILIGVVSLPIVLRGLRVQMEPSPTNIQASIKTSILSIIPLAAAVAVLGAGRTWGIAVFALIAPAVFLAMRLRVT